MKTLIIADPHKPFRRVLKRLLPDFNLVGDCADGDTLLETVRQKKPDLLILELSIPRQTGMSIIRDMRKRHTDIKILVMTIQETKDFVYSVFDEGADGYINKDEGLVAFRSAISCILSGGKYVSPSLKGEKSLGCVRV